MTKFYQYDTRGASAATQIINLERMLEERDAEISRLREENKELEDLVSSYQNSNADLASVLSELANICKRQGY